MKPNKPKLFTEEFVTLCLLVLSLAIGGACIVVYKDRLPLWMILAIGFWYPALVLVYRIWNYGKGDEL